MILKDNSSSNGLVDTTTTTPQQIEEDELILAVDVGDGEEGSFDSIIGCIEDIVIDEKFQDIQENLLRTHCDEFDETSEENKLVYTEIYQLYTNSVEDYIKTELEKRISNFVMKDFIKQLEQKRSELDGDVFEMLFTLTDFLAFKEMMIDFKLMRDSGALDEILSVKQISSSIQDTLT